jgi:hypothetical protein
VRLARGDVDGARRLLDQAIAELRAAFPQGHAFLPRLERQLAGAGDAELVRP